MKLGRLVRLTVAMLALPLLAYAQDATLSGTIKDNTGGGLPAVPVTATTQAPRITSTSAPYHTQTHRLPTRLRSTTARRTPPRPTPQPPTTARKRRQRATRRAGSGPTGPSRVPTVRQGSAPTNGGGHAASLPVSPAQNQPRYRRSATAE